MSQSYKYTVNYKDKDTFERLKQSGDVIYYSKVLNFLFLLSYLDYDTIKSIEGVTYVKKNYYY